MSSVNPQKCSYILILTKPTIWVSKLIFNRFKREWPFYSYYSPYSYLLHHSSPTLHLQTHRDAQKESQEERNTKGARVGIPESKDPGALFCVSSTWIGEGYGTPLQYSCLENPMDGGTWWAAVHGVARSRTWLSDFTFTFHFHALEKEMATHSSVLAWRIPGMREPDGLPSLGSHGVRYDWSDLAAAAAVPGSL